MIRFACPECRWVLEVSEDRGGGTVGCPNCGRSLGVPTLVPTGGAAAAPAPGYQRGSYRRPPAAAFRAATALARRVSPFRRFGSPASLLIALALSSLPWVEVRCDRPLNDRGTKIIASQSGLQAAFGRYTAANLLDSDRAERERVEARIRALHGESDLSWSLPLILFEIVLLGGGLYGFLAWRSRSRPAVMVVWSLAACVLFLLQVSRGFPLEQAVRTVGAEGQWAGTDFRISLGTSSLLKVAYTPWFWLSAVALGCAVTAAWAEWRLTPGAGRRNWFRTG